VPRVSVNDLLHERHLVSVQTMRWVQDAQEGAIG
jgi:hypothetical protein